MMILRIGNRMTVNVGSLAEASAEYAKERDASGEGASTFPAGTIMQNRRKIAHVSYNAKVWPPEPWTPKLAPLFDPYR